MFVRPSSAFLPTGAALRGLHGVEFA